MEKVKSFNTDVETIITDKNMDYIDAVLLWCLNNKVEVEYAADLIKLNSNILLKIQKEGEALNILKKTTSLPI